MEKVVLTLSEFINEGKSSSTFSSKIESIKNRVKELCSKYNLSEILAEENYVDQIYVYFDNIGTFNYENGRVSRHSKKKIDILGFKIEDGKLAITGTWIERDSPDDWGDQEEDVFYEENIITSPRNMEMMNTWLDEWEDFNLEDLKTGKYASVMNISSGNAKGNQILSGKITTILPIVDKVDKIPVNSKVAIGNQDLPKGTYDIVLYRKGEYTLEPDWSKEKVYYVVDEKDLHKAMGRNY